VQKGILVLATIHHPL